ncbi:hypothetical protein V6N13_091817 [Hibiscus sabdariffa]
MVENKQKGKERCSEQGESSLMKVSKNMRVLGHVEVEDLWKLKRCLVGEMATVCSVENDDLFMMLEDLNWSCLKEIFRDVKLWSESLSMVKRTTWIEITGVPLHSWNKTTFKRLVELWGEFEAFGENLEFGLDCEKMRVLITTNLPQKINVVMDLEVGNMVYEVRINEAGFSDIVGRKHELSKMKVDNGSKQNNAESMMSEQGSCRRQGW